MSSSLMGKIRDTLRRDRHKDDTLVVPQPGSPLCGNCQMAFRHWHLREDLELVRSNPKFREKHHSIVNLELSANAGCPTCILLRRCLKEVEIVFAALPAFDPLSPSTLLLWSYGVTGGNLCLLFNRINGDSSNVKIDVQLARGFDNGHEVAKVAEKTDCPQVWDLIDKWMDRCTADHKECRALIMPRRLPTRLIDIGPSNDKARLCLSTTLPSSTEYLTLSHCWGDLIIDTLTRQNLAQLLDGIPMSALSKTFQDALSVTRRLGYSYIWIDSLCIMQGDSEDWARESTSMGEIYSGSALNIAAASAPNGNTGLFFDQRSSDIHGFKVKARGDETEPSESLWNCMPMDFFRTLAGATPVGQRAWVFQEIFLAPRTIYFGKDEIAWECRVYRACETFPESLGYAERTISNASLNWGTAKESSPISEWGNLWGEIVLEYSKGNLTVPTDKLVAVSGISRNFGLKFKIDYIAGLWKQDLKRQLTWHIDLKSRKSRPKEYRAPSWSWASVNGQVLWSSLANAHGAGIHISIEDSWVSHAGPDSYGHISGGQLRVKCQRPSKAGMIYKPYTDEHNLTLGTEPIDWSFVYPDTSPHELDGDVYFMPVLYDRGTRTWLWGLYLELIGPNKFRRVGACCLFRNAVDDFYTAQESPDAVKYSGGEAAGVDSDGNSIIIIDII